MVTILLNGNEFHRNVTGEDQLSRNISSVSFSVDGRLITMDITAAPESRYKVSENGTYQVNMRPSA